MGHNLGRLSGVGRRWSWPVYSTYRQLPCSLQGVLTCAAGLRRLIQFRFADELVGGAWTPPENGSTGEHSFNFFGF